MSKAPPPLTTDSKGAKSRKPLPVRIILLILLIVIPVVVLILGIGVAGYFVATAPKAEQKAAVQEAQLVDVEVVQSGDYSVKVKAMGAVLPSKRITLQPQVSGQLVAVSEKFIPGGKFGGGETIVKVNPEDYTLIVKQRQANVVKARHDLKIEQGQQVIAKREFELIGNGSSGDQVDRDLILRKPQLELATASVEAAQAALAKAILDKNRTTVTAPFNAVIVDKQQVDLGSQVSPNSQIAVLANTDEFYVVASVPINSLRWIGLGKAQKTLEGATVRIFNETAWAEGAERSGKIVGLLSMLETQGRLARVLVSVKDPLCLKPENSELPKLLLGMYVSLEVEGSKLKDVVRIDRTSLRDGDTVWVFGADKLLEIRQVKVERRGRDDIYISSGLTAGERIVTSDLAVRISGTPLKIDAPATQPATQLTTQPGDQPK